MSLETPERTATTATARVCVFTTAHDSTDSRVVEREAASLAANGYDVTYYTPFDGDCSVDVVSYDDVADGSMLSISERLQAAVKVAVELADSEYDVYHFHDVEALPVGVLLSVLTDAEIVYDVHENVEDTLKHKPIFSWPLREIIARVASVTELTLSQFVDELIVASPDVAERFADRENVTVVTNYPRRKWAEGTVPAEHIDPDPDAPTELVYRGLPSEDRGIGTIIDAVERVPDDRDIRLSIGGKYGSDADREAIEPRIEQSDRVEFVEWFPSLAGMIDHFRDADIGLICFHPAPNKTNAAHRSNKLFQYMAAGLPIVVSDIGNWPTVVGEADCGVAVDPEDPAAVAEAITDLVDDPQRRAELGRNGHQAALDQYNWEAQEAKLLEVYAGDPVAANSE
jgi:glycosyltransferase involved in cell wall biosynthesis